MAYVAVNMEPAQFFQAQTDTFLRGRGIGVCGNDYTTTNRYALRRLFDLPSGNNPDPRPVFVALNCATNSPSHAHWQVLVKEFYNGGGAIDFSASIASWRNLIDSVQAPPPLITEARFSGDAFEFTVPGQRGQTNRIEFTSTFSSWTTLTNIFGSNGPVSIRDVTTSDGQPRFYRVLRP